MQHDIRGGVPHIGFDVKRLSGRISGADPTPAVKLDVRHVGFHYGKQRALNDVSLPIYANRITALIGPSGCGKSTLLRVFNRMPDLYDDQHVEGEVLLDGVDLLGHDIDVLTLRRRVGMVTQKPAPFPMSIYDNVAIGMRLNEELDPAALNARVEDALRRAALWEEVHDILDHNALSLSGGQQQRLCLARTMAVKPEVILLDEPCSALDPISTAKIEATIEALKSTSTAVIVTHNLQEAARIADYTAFLYMGTLVEFGPTEQIFSNPADERTALYVTGKIG